MAKFVLKNIEAVKGRLQFRQLIILDEHEDARLVQQKIDEAEREGLNIELGKRSELERYEESLELKYKSVYDRIMGYMNRVANLQLLPQEKFKEVTPAKESVKEYEFKYGDLRVWAIKIPNGQLVVIGGYKNTQKADFRTFRSLKAQYLTFLNNKRK